MKIKFESKFGISGRKSAVKIVLRETKAKHASFLEAYTELLVFVSIGLKILDHDFGERKKTHKIARWRIITFEHHKYFTNFFGTQAACTRRKYCPKKFQRQSATIISTTSILLKTCLCRRDTRFSTPYSLQVFIDRCIKLFYARLTSSVSYFVRGLKTLAKLTEISNSSTTAA